MKIRHSRARSRIAGEVCNSLVAAIGLAAAGQAIAQLTGQAPAGPTVLAETVVVAQKRPESTQDIPVAVTPFDAEAIRRTGMLELTQLTELHPSVSFDTAQSFERNSLKIRGVGTIGNSRTFEGTVGVFLDGVYRPRSGMVLMDLLDVERLEILRGPQSTLFGKNTVAGTIVVASTRPDVYAREGSAELRIGNHDTRYLTGAVNLPFADRSALRIAGSVHERDGFFKSVDTGAPYDEVDQHAFKAQFLAIRDSFELSVIADYAKSDANCCWGSAQVFNGPTTPLVQAYASLNGLTYTNAPAAERDRSASLNTTPGELVEDGGLSVRLEWDLGDDITLTSLTSLRDWENTQIDADADFVPADLFILNEPADIENFSQELNLLLPLRRRGNTTDDILLGFYYANEDYGSRFGVETGHDADNYLNALISSARGATACLPGVIAVDCLFPVGIGALLADGQLSRTIFEQESESIAAYAHARISLTEKLGLVTGLRYTIEDKEGGADNTYWYDSPIVRQVLAMGGVPDDGTPRNGFDLIGTFYSPSFHAGTRDNDTTGLLSLQYDFNDSLMIYGGFHRGYKAGGVNLFREAVVTNTTTYEPEVADSVEAGIKADYLGGRARTNVAIFDTEFSNLQINFFTGLEFKTVNTGEATTKGFEVENLFQITDALRLDFSVTHLDAKYDRIDEPFLSYLVGRDLERAPEWAAVATVSYRRPLGNGMTFLARGMASYMGEHFVGSDVPTEQKVDSYATSDVEVGLAGRNLRWEATLWCRNCADETYRTIYFNSTFQPGSYSAYLNAPRQVGFTVRTSF